MSDMNIVCLTGRLTRKPELKKTASGKSFVSVNIAINEGKDTNGHDVAQFPQINVWGKAAENMCLYLDKGSKISVVGKLITRSWTRNDGSKTYSTEVIASKVDLFLEGKKNDASPQIPITYDDLPY